MPDSMNLFVVGPEHLDRAWRDGADKLEEALKHAPGECTIDQLKYRIARGETILLMIEGEKRAWIAVEFWQMPNMRVLHVYAIYAPGATMQAAFELLEQYAIAGGASAIQGACTEAVSKLWARKFGFQEMYRISRRMLWADQAAPRT